MQIDELENSWTKIPIKVVLSIGLYIKLICQNPVLLPYTSGLTILKPNT